MTQESQKENAIEKVIELTFNALDVLDHMRPNDLIHMDLGLPHVKAIFILFLSGPLRMSSLASSMGVSLPMATAVVKRLVNTDLVIRETSPNDRRVIICQLSDKGQRLMSIRQRVDGGKARTMLKQLTHSQLLAIADGLETILQHTQR